jgi:integrase
MSDKPVCSVASHLEVVAMEDNGKQKRKRGHRGAGSIDELPSGRFRAVVSAGKDPTTKNRIRVTRTFALKKDAIAWRNAEVAKLNRGMMPVSPYTRQILSAWLDRWLADKKTQVQPATWHTYERRVRLHLKPLLGDMILGKLTDDHIQAMFSEMAKRGDSASEQHKAADVLRTALADAVPKHIPFNPAIRVKRPLLERPEINPMEEEQARSFLAAIQGDRLQTWFQLALDSGMRPGEVCGLRWQDVSWDAGEVAVVQAIEEIKGKLRVKPPKTKAARRRIALAPETMESLRRHRERMQAEGRDVETGLVFVDNLGGILSQSHIRERHFVPALKRAGLTGRGFRPYCLRHTCATLLLKAGVNVMVVSRRLGHKNISVTLRNYAHVLPTMQDQARVVVSSLFYGRQSHDSHTDTRTGEQIPDAS